MPLFFENWQFNLGDSVLGSGEQRLYVREVQALSQSRGGGRVSSNQLQWTVLARETESLIDYFRLQTKTKIFKENQKSPTVKMSALLNLVDQNADTLQQMALLAYVKDPELGEPFLEAITTYKVSIFLTRLIYRNLLIVYNRIHTFFNLY